MDLGANDNALTPNPLSRERERGLCGSVMMVAVAFVFLFGNLGDGSFGRQQER